MMLRHQLLLACFVLEACIFSLALSSEMLPEKEMQELDIFMQDGEYYEISRTKRTENGTAEDVQEEIEGSAMEDLEVIGHVTTTPVDSDHPTPTTQVAISKNEGDGTTPLPLADSFTPGPTSEIDDSEDNSPTNKPENPEETENTTTSDDADTLNQTTTDSKDRASTEPSPVTVEGATTKQSDVRVTIATPLENEAEPESENSDRLEPELRSRSGESPVDVSNITSYNANETTTNDIQPEIPPTVAATPKAPIHNIQSIPEANNTINHNTTNTDIKGTKLDAPGAGGTPLATTAKSIANVSNTPKTGESDLPNKSSVSGSGILFTIIAIIGIAGLAAAGYYMYKRRQQGYNPVAVEERREDKEMTEVTTGNGFGKPISAEEVKLNDQLTPIEPKAAPRTFALTPPDEAPLENVEVVKDDNENRDKREQSVEFEEEANKKDEQ